MKSVLGFLLIVPVLSMAGGAGLRADVIDVRGSAETSILEYQGDPAPVQSDLSVEIVPLTKPELPATAQSGLDRLAGDGSTTAAASAVARLESPDIISGNPNDVGIDLAAFSLDDVTSWRLESIVNETRVLNLSPLELGATDLNPPATRVTSKVSLSGVMSIEALDAQADLTDVEVALSISVTQRRPNSDSTVLAGELALVGHPDGQVSVDRASGVFDGVSFNIVDASVPGIGLAKFLTLKGMSFTYEYDVAANEEFNLELSVRSHVITKPGGIGAAATFSDPQAAIVSVFDKVTQDNKGQDIADAISQHVDTTGQAYINGGTGSFTPLGICGASSVEIPALAMGMGLLTVTRARRRRLRRAQ